MIGNELQRLEEEFAKDETRVVTYYGIPGCGKEEVIGAFLKGKQYVYYRTREVSYPMQAKLMREECFAQIAGVDSNTKIVVVLDEVQNVLKDPGLFLQEIKKVFDTTRKLLIILTSSSLVAVEKKWNEELTQMSNVMLRARTWNFLDIVRMFPDFSMKQSVEVYGILGGIPAFLFCWSKDKTMKENICNLILNRQGALYEMPEKYLSLELRELAVYQTLLMVIASGKEKLNEIYLETGYSRAKISVYLKNLMDMDIVEKVVSFESGGWNETKKGIYQIKDTFIKFWYQFVFPHKSMLFCMSTEEFYEKYIEEEIEDYLADAFTKVCTEYMKLQNQVGKLPLKITKMGKWIGKTGTIDFVLQNEIRENIVGICNWKQETFEMERFEQLQELVEKSRIKPKYYFLFSAKKFAEDVTELAKNNEQIVLVDMLEL